MLAKTEKSFGPFKKEYIPFITQFLRVVEEPEEALDKIKKALAELGSEVTPEKLTEAVKFQLDYLSEKKAFHK